MSGNSNNTRRVGRIPREMLPENLKSFTMVLPNGRMSVVTTYDASIYGLGLIVPMKPELVGNQANVTLYPEDNSFSLFGYVVFLIPDGSNRCRIGVQFGKLQSGDIYLEMLQKSSGEAG